MTVSSTNKRNDYQGNGASVAFAFTFEVELKSEVKVIITDELGQETQKVLDTDYTVEINPNTLQGVVTFTVAPLVTESITLLRNIALTQQTDYINIGTGKFPADSHEKALDKLTRIAQQQQEEIDRSILLPQASTLTGITIPVSPENANSAIVVNSTGDDLTAANLLDIDTVPVSTFMTGHLTDETAQEARLTLDAQEDVIVDQGDIVTGDALGMAQRLPIGTANQILTSDGIDVAWSSNASVSKLITPTSGELTIASGIITATGSRHTVDTESDASTDDLDTINGGSEGQIINITNANTARAVVVKHATGNILIPGGDITLEDTNKELLLAYDGSIWHAINMDKIVQIVDTQTGAVATGSTVIPFDDTIPQNTEGDEYMTLSIGPTNSKNKLKIDVVAHVYNGFPNTIVTGALFQDSNPDALAASIFSDDPTSSGIITFTHYMTAGTTSSTTFKLRLGPPSPNIITFNGYASTRRYGGVYASSITITEIQA